MKGLDELLAREELKELKARYFRFTDMHDFESFGKLFVDDAIMEAAQLAGPSTLVARGRDEIVRQAALASEGAIKIHHGHNCEITIGDRDTASGIWAVEYLFFDENSSTSRRLRHNFAYYYENYVRVADEWKFAAVKIVNVHTDVDGGPPSSEIGPSGLLRSGV